MHRKAKLFDTKIITLWNIKLSPMASDVECLTVFLAYSSHKQWEELNLCGCYIQDCGVHILHRGLTSCDVTVAILHLNYNGLTESSSTAISDIAISCNVKELYISSNKIVGEDERLYSIISDPSSMLELLYMSFNKISSWSGAIKLFTALSKGKKLKALKISFNNITDEACDAIIVAMRKNTSLIKLLIYNNPLSGECVQRIVESLQYNNALQQLRIGNFNGDIIERIKLSAKEVNRKRECSECQVKLKVDFYTTELSTLNQLHKQ